MTLVVFEDIPQVFMAVYFMIKKYQEEAIHEIRLTTKVTLLVSLILPFYTVIKFVSFTIYQISLEARDDLRNPHRPSMRSIYRRNNNPQP